MTQNEPRTDECYRCGYDLRGIANDQACPECGLLAERSRRVTDELHETRPKWLRSISIGAILILLSIVVEIAWAMCVPMVIVALDDRWINSWQWLRWMIPSGFLLGAFIFVVGVFLLTRREGYPPADRADRWLRRWLRRASITPLLAASLAVAGGEIDFPYSFLGLVESPIAWLVSATMSVHPLEHISHAAIRHRSYTSCAASVAQMETG